MTTANICIQENSAADFMTSVNAALLALTDPTIRGFEPRFQRPLRRLGIEHACVITYTTAGAALATPFTLSVLEATTLGALNTLLAAFQIAQSAGFVAASKFEFQDDEGTKQSKYIAYTIYNATAGASANYVPR